MTSRHHFAIATVAASIALPAFAQSGSVYSEMLVKDSVDRNVECAATIFALGQNTDLAAVIAVFFINDATNTLTTLGGWDDREAASKSVQSRVGFRAEDIRLVAGVTTPVAELERQQFECVMGRFQD